MEMFCNGSNMQNRVGVGILFVTLYGYTIPKSYKLLFPCTKNIVEYEAKAHTKMENKKIAYLWRLTTSHQSSEQ